MPRALQPLPAHRPSDWAPEALPALEKVSRQDILGRIEFWLEALPAESLDRMLWAEVQAQFAAVQRDPG